MQISQEHVTTKSSKNLETVGGTPKIGAKENSPEPRRKSTVREKTSKDFLQIKPKRSGVRKLSTQKMGSPVSVGNLRPHSASEKDKVQSSSSYQKQDTYSRDHIV